MKNFKLFPEKKQNQTKYLQDIPKPSIIKYKHIDSDKFDSLIDFSMRENNPVI